MDAFWVKHKRWRLGLTGDPLAQGLMVLVDCQI